LSIRPFAGAKLHFQRIKFEMRG